MLRLKDAARDYCGPQSASRNRSIEAAELRHQILDEARVVDSNGHAGGGVIQAFRVTDRAPIILTPQIEVEACDQRRIGCHCYRQGIVEPTTAEVRRGRL